MKQLTYMKILFISQLLVWICVNSTDDYSDDCSVKLVIPREHFKATCDNSHGLNARNNELELEIDKLKQEIESLKIKQIKNHMDTSSVLEEHTEKISTLGSLFNKHQQDYSHQDQTAVMDLQLSDLFSKKKIVKLFKPYLTDEIERMGNLLEQRLYKKFTSWYEQKDNVDTLSTDKSKNTDNTNTQTYDSDELSVPERKSHIQPQPRKSSDGSSVKNQKIFGKFYQKHEKESLSEKPQAEQPIHVKWSQFEKFKNEIKEEIKEILIQHGKRTESKILNITNKTEEFEKEFNRTVKKIYENIKDIDIATELKTTSERIDYLNSTAQLLVEGDVNRLTVIKMLEVEKNNIKRYVDDKTNTMEITLMNVLKKQMADIRKTLDSKIDTVSHETLRNRFASLTQKLHDVEKRAVKINDTLEKVLDFNAQREEMQEIDTSTYEELINGTIGKLVSMADLQRNDINNLNNTLNFFNTSIKSLSDSLKTRLEDTEQNVTKLQSIFKSSQDFVKLLVENEMHEVIANVSHFKDNVMKSIRISALETHYSKPLRNWVEYNFTYYEESSNGCRGGKQFVKQTKFRKIVGVSLCSATRYKIYLSPVLTEPFRDIGDRRGIGDDHCEFVGASKGNKINVYNDTYPQKSVRGKKLIPSRDHHS